jgi:hypothetical protein
MSDRSSNLLLAVFAFLAGLGLGVAGTMLWRPSQPVPAMGGASNAPTAVPSAGAANAASPAAPQAAAVFINQKQATPEQLEELKRTYGQAPPPGRYWYDPRSGLYGMWGHEAAGYIRPGHDFGALPADASNGNTGVFINGREINLTEAGFFQRVFGAVYQGRWWLDGQTGNVGLEGNPMPVANLVVALQQAQRSGSGSGGGYRWRDEINRASGGAEGGCVWVNMPGSSYSSSGCN